MCQVLKDGHGISCAVPPPQDWHLRIVTVEDFPLAHLPSSISPYRQAYLFIQTKGRWDSSYWQGSSARTQCVPAQIVRLPDDDSRLSEGDKRNMSRAAELPRWAPLSVRWRDESADDSSQGFSPLPCTCRLAKGFAKLGRAGSAAGNSGSCICGMDLGAARGDLVIFARVLSTRVLLLL